MQLADNPEQFIVINTTFHSADEARELTAELLDRQLIAAGQISELHSLYWWDGQQQEEDEWQLSALTRAGLYQRVAEFITAKHSFILPEIIAVPVVALGAEYSQWIEEYTVDPDNLLDTEQ